MATMLGRRNVYSYAVFRKADLYQIRILAVLKVSRFTLGDNDLIEGLSASRETVASRAMVAPDHGLDGSFCIRDILVVFDGGKY